MGSLLEISDLRVGYLSRRPILHGVSLSISSGETYLLLGHNGAGKTTLLKSAFGVLPPWSGFVKVNEVQIGSGSRPAVRFGVSYSPAGGGNVLRGMTVSENLRISAEASLVSKEKLQGRIEIAYEAFPVLKTIPKMIAGQLSGGQQRMLSVGMTLAQEPKVLLLDEPSLGLSPVASEQLYAQINKATADNNIAVLLVEQNINTSFVKCDRFGILRMGEFVYEGIGKDLSDKETEKKLMSFL